ncbi:MAG: T9SS type A sorting domain-containing protein, partial [candidate division WOR-3 bacterium]
GVARIGTARGLSLFTWQVERDTADGVAPRVYPNPCIVGLHGGVVVDQLPVDAEVHVFTLGGAPLAVVKSSPGLGRAVWLPGRLASGIYILVIRSTRGTRVERVALVGP